MKDQISSLMDDDLDESDVRIISENILTLDEEHVTATEPAEDEN